MSTPNNRWKLQDAKNKFSELVDTALSHGPQIVTRHGEEVVVVLSASLYQKKKKPTKDLVDFFRSSPLKGLEFERDESPIREDFNV